MNKVREISVFFPCYNESENLPVLVARAAEVLPDLAEEYEIIIVDDGSRDGTRDTALDLARRFENVKVESHGRNRGYGAALRTGFAASSKELVFYTDGDGQYELGELARFLPLLRDCDIVSGYRISRQDPLPRRINAAVYNASLWLLFGMRIRDIDCAFKLYKRELFDRIKIESDGAVVDAEILLKARKLGYRIKQLGVSHFPRRAGSATGAKIGVVLRAIKELLWLRLRH